MFEIAEGNQSFLPAIESCRPRGRTVACTLAIDAMHLLLCCMKRVLTALSLLITVTTALAQNAPLITDSVGRQTLNLNGEWKIIIDPYDSGLFTSRNQIQRNGYFRNAKPQSPSELIEYDFDKSESLWVPGDWNSQDPRLFFYEGTVWYKRSFDYQPKPNMRVFLHTGAANYMARVWVNGEFACDHEGGFTPFDCEVGKLLHPGSNFAVIQVNNQRKRSGVPALSTDWWNYGGLTRDVALVEVPTKFVQDYSIQLKRGTTDQIVGWAQVSDAEGRQHITVRIPELKLERSFDTDESGRADIAFSAIGLQLWSPESPKLYEVEIEGAGDQVREQIGFRTVEVRGQDILLNGKPVFLRGVTIHEEAPFRSGRAYSEKDGATLLSWAKELNCNFVRLAHYPHNEHMTRLADQMGMLVWSEIPVYWVVDFTDPTTLATAKQQLSEMITRDRNRASIVLWSVANETPSTPERLAFLRDLIAIARRLDPSRLTTAAMNTVHMERGTIAVDEPLGADLDVLGVNEYIGWYSGKPEDADTTKWTNPYRKPMILSEFGADAKYGLHGAIDQRFTEEYQENLYRHQITMLREIPFLRGMSPWILMDFRSPRRPLAGIQDFYNRKGLVSEIGEKKKAFFVLQEFYRAKAAQR